MKTSFKRTRLNVHFNGESQVVLGWLAKSQAAQTMIFVCKGDSLTDRYPWYAFNVNGEQIGDRDKWTREDAFFYAELELLMSDKNKSMDAIPF